MIRDILGLALASLATAAFCTFAVAQAFGLLRRGSHIHVLVGLFFPPAGAWLAFRAGMPIRAAGCLVSLCLYAIARVLA
jgi:uncharacterized membrane protein